MKGFRWIGKGVDKVQTKILMSIVRHALTTFGGGLVTAGYASADDLEVGVGALMTLIGLGLSIWARTRPPQS